VVYQLSNFPSQLRTKNESAATMQSPW